jgi:hypothetical protein
LGPAAPTGIAIIKPEEYRKLDLPSDWGTWDDGVEPETAWLGVTHFCGRLGVTSNSIVL